MPSFTLYQRNAQIITLSGLTRTSDNTLVSGASLTATLYDGNGKAIDSLKAQPLVDVAGTPGSYSLAFGDDGGFTPPTGGGYTLVIDGMANGFAVHIERPAVVAVNS